MSLAQLLPNAQRRLTSVTGTKTATPTAAKPTAIVAPNTVPPIGQRQGYIPRNDSCYGDGGAFPEIHRLQYPLGMGRRNQSNSGAIATLSVGADGAVDYSGIVTQRVRKDQMVYKSYNDLVPKDPSQDELAKPDAEQERAITEETRLALEKIVDVKISAGQPRSKPVENAHAVGPSYVRYSSKDGGTRVVRLQTLAVDPIEPAKFKHMKAPAGPPSPPVPIMHSPPRKVTVADQNMWKIPPCISNWKNIKGYTIAADKRLASDGRGLQEVQINDAFASLSETLYLAERNARAEVAARQSMQSRIELKKREVKEQQLLELAAEAREKRAGINQTIRQVDTYGAGDDEGGANGKTEIEELEEREEVRADRKRELRRELRMSHMGKNARQSKMERDSNRDVSEMVALGKKVGVGGGDSLFDQRLFNQSQGMSSGFGADDAYNAYDSHLFESRAGQHIYRPAQQADQDYAPVQDMLDKSVGKFQPARGFDGADTTVEQRAAGRSKPVQFERGPEDSIKMDQERMTAEIAASEPTPAAVESDPFGLDKFLTAGQRGGRGINVGQSGFLTAAAGGSGSGEAPSSTRPRQIFTAATDIPDTSRGDSHKPVRQRSPTPPRSDQGRDRQLASMTHPDRRAMMSPRRRVSRSPPSRRRTSRHSRDRRSSSSSRDSRSPIRRDSWSKTNARVSNRRDRSFSSSSSSSSSDGDDSGRQQRQRRRRE